MSQKYRFRSLQLLEEEKEEKQSKTLSVFETGETKTIDFVLLDGTRQNFAYSHYITSWIGKEEGNRVIKIFFSTHLVTVEGFCLDEVYNALIQFSLKSLRAIDERYSSLANEEKAYVSNIKVTWKGIENFSGL